MSDHIWISRSLFDSANWRALTSDLAERDRACAIECGKQNDSGESLGPECFSTVIWPAENARKRDTSASVDFFLAGTHWVVSGRFATLLGQFEMGETNLYPVRFLQADRATPVKGEWFCLNFGNRKTTLMADESAKLEPTFRPGQWKARPTFQDGDLCFSQAALEGGAIWIDPSLVHVVCLSGPLGDLMRENGVTRGFQGLGDLRQGRNI